MLRTQYRCHPRISALANALFYENNLLDGVIEEERPPLVVGIQDREICIKSRLI